MANDSNEIPFFDLKPQYRAIKGDIDAAIARVFESQQFILGPEVAAFEREVAEYCGVKHALAVSSGTDALLVALMALGIKAGDEVITTPFTFFATAGSIARLGATPVFVDIAPNTLNINPDLLSAAISSRTKAIMPVHIFGQCAEMDKINAIAQKHGLYVIEDACQAIGAEYRGKRAGALADFGCFSFFPTKNLGACGEGGLVTTNKDALAEKARLLRAHGAKSEYYHEMIGGNFRLHGLQGAILRAKLPYLDRWNEQRRRHSELYAKLFKTSGIIGNQIIIPAEEPHCKHVYHQYVVRAKSRDQLMQYLKEKGIGTKVYYPKPLHLQECFSALNIKPADCSESEHAASEVLALPIFPELSTSQIERVAAEIAEFYSKH